MANTIAPANTIATTNINSNSNNQKESNTKHGTTKRSFLCIFLTVGLLLTFLDVLYIMLYLSPDQPFNNADRQHHHRAVVMALVDAGSRRSTAADTENSNPDPAAASRQQHYNLPVTRAKDRAIQTLPSDWTNDDSPGKDENAPNNKQQQQQQNSNNNPIVQLLTEAMGVVDPATAARLPSSHAVAALYGRDPVVLGLESCAAFRSHNPFVRDPADHFVATAGTFNTGTNLMAELLIANCVLPERQQKYGTRGVRWQVVWGKHTPVDDEAYRQSHRTYDDVNLQANAMFPAVMVRDPFKWMQSMCRHPYAADWIHDPDHCPNLLPNEIDLNLMSMEEKDAISTGVTMNVTVTYAEFTRQHATLVEFWNDWYKAYVEAPFPRLIVRFEDVVFHPKQITKTVCECAGGILDPSRPFRYIVDSAKKGAAHGTEKTSYVDALIKYGTEEGRYKGFEPEDLEYAREQLDPDLMRLFGYSYPPLSTSKE